MIRLLLIGLIIAAIVGILILWRYESGKNAPTVPTQTTQVDSSPIEVPKTLPQASLDDRVKGLEDVITKLVTEVNNLKSQAASQPSNLETRVEALESGMTELKVRVSALEKGTTATTTGTGGASSIYIPLGSGGNWSYSDWTTLPEYEISLDPANFPNYSGMTLEVTFRVDDPSGTGSIRFYNQTDGGSVSSQLDTTSTTFNTQSTSSFKLAGGSKTYRIQIKSTNGKNLFIQTARLKVSF